MSNNTVLNPILLSFPSDLARMVSSSVGGDGKIPVEVFFNFIIDELNKGRVLDHDSIMDIVERVRSNDDLYKYLDKHPDTIFTPFILYYFMRNTYNNDAINLYKYKDIIRRYLPEIFIIDKNDYNFFSDKISSNINHYKPRTSDFSNFLRMLKFRLLIDRLDIELGIRLYRLIEIYNKDYDGMAAICLTCIPFYNDYPIIKECIDLLFTTIEDSENRRSFTQSYIRKFMKAIVKDKRSYFINFIENLSLEGIISIKEYKRYNRSLLELDID